MKFNLNQIKIMSATIAMSMVAVYSINASATARTGNHQLTFEDSNVNLTDPESLTLAAFKLSNGHSVTFTQTGDEYFINETGPTGANEVAIMELLEGNPLDKFLALTLQDVPVPISLIELANEITESERMDLKAYQSNDELSSSEEAMHQLNQFELINTQRMQHLAQRKVVNHLPSERFIELDTIKLKTALPLLKAAGQGSCNNSTGYIYFEENHCGTRGSHGDGSSENYCDNGMHAVVQRTTKKRARSTYERAAYCGEGHAHIQHYRYYSQWGQEWVKLGPTVHIDPYNWLYSESWIGNLNARRYLRVRVTATEGYIRGWTRFFQRSK